MSVARFRIALATVAFAVLAACSAGTYQRGMFQGFVVGNSAEEVSAKVGKPDSVDETDPTHPRWVYLKKTFDPDNMNKADERTTVIFESRDGKMVATEVLFS